MNINQWINDMESHFFLYTRDQPIVHQELAIINLINSKQAVSSFLQAYGKQIKAFNLQAPATYFSSKLGIACSAYVTILALHHFVVPLTTNSLAIQLYRNEQYNEDGMVLKLNSDKWQQGGQSKEWRMEQIEKLFQTTVTPLLQSFAVAANIRIRELWGQVTNGLEYGKKVGLNLAENEAQKERIHADFNWLTKAASPLLFNSSKNELDFPYIEVASPTEPGVMKRMKPTCCLYYQTECSTSKCYTCPRMTSVQREERRLELALK